MEETIRDICEQLTSFSKEVIFGYMFSTLHCVDLVCCTEGFLFLLFPFGARIIRADLHGPIFVACDKLATGLRHDLRLPQHF